MKFLYWVNTEEVTHAGPGRSAGNCEGRGTMPGWLTDVFSLTRSISSKAALPVFLALGLVLYLPAPHAEPLGIIEFRQAYRIWIGALFILSATALASNFIWAIGGILKPWLRDLLFIWWNRPVLRRLTEDEKAILRVFIIEGKSTVTAEVTSGPINMLVAKNIVYRASTLSVRYTIFAYVLQPWAREYLEKKPHLLD